MPAALSFVQIPISSMKKVQGKDTREKLATILRDQSLLECHGRNTKVEVAAFGEGRYIARAEVEHTEGFPNTYKLEYEINAHGPDCRSRCLGLGEIRGGKNSQPHFAVQLTKHKEIFPA